jgi:phosphatidylglycerophosphatase A
LGTLVAVPIYLGLMLYTDPTIYLIATALSVMVGIWVCDQSAKKLAVQDFGGIVWDEVAGFLITLYGLPLTWQTLLAGFVAFRLFDIVKPWPIRYLDKQVGGGFGIMLDDVVAGVFAALVLRIWF